MMNSIQYVSKVGQITPLYDKEKNSYLIITEEDEIEIPKELFHKIFREFTEDEKQQIERFINFTNNDKEDPEITYLKNMFNATGKDFEKTAEIVRLVNMDREEFIDSIIKVTKTFNTSGVSESDIRESASKVYDYIMNSD